MSLRWEPKQFSMKQEVIGNRRFLVVFCICMVWLWFPEAADAAQQLKFNQQGQFKILQVADMHYGNGITTQCEDILPDQMASCSDLNTTAFVNRMIKAEKPDLIVYTGICNSTHQYVARSFFAKDLLVVEFVFIYFCTIRR